MQQFACPSCGKLISAATDPGSFVQCPLCSQTVTVPFVPQIPATSAQPQPQIPATGVQPQAQVQRPAKKSSGSRGLAVTSLVFGLLGVSVGIFACPGVLSLVAIILGAVALVKSSDDDAESSRGPAIGGVVTGAIGLIAGPVILFVLIFPAFNAMRDMGEKTFCQSNLQQIGWGIEMYADQDPDGALPENMGSVVNAGYMMAFSLDCPTQVAGQQSYFYVPGQSSAEPNAVVMFENPSNHGGTGGHVLYKDGSVVFVEDPEFQNIVDQYSDRAQ